MTVHLFLEASSGRGPTTPGDGLLQCLPGGLCNQPCVRPNKASGWQGQPDHLGQSQPKALLPSQIPHLDWSFWHLQDTTGSFGPHHLRGALTCWPELRGEHLPEALVLLISTGDNRAACPSLTLPPKETFPGSSRDLVNPSSRVGSRFLPSSGAPSLDRGVFFRAPEPKAALCRFVPRVPF